MDEDFDQQELEALLYSQIHYKQEGDAEANTNVRPYVEPPQSKQPPPSQLLQPIKQDPQQQKPQQQQQQQQREPQPTSELQKQETLEQKPQQQQSKQLPNKQPIQQQQRGGGAGAQQQQCKPPQQLQQQRGGAAAGGGAGGGGGAAGGGGGGGGAQQKPKPPQPPQQMQQQWKGGAALEEAQRKLQAQLQKQPRQQQPQQQPQQQQQRNLHPYQSFMTSHAPQTYKDNRNKSQRYHKNQKLYQQQQQEEGFYQVAIDTSRENWLTGSAKVPQNFKNFKNQKQRKPYRPYPNGTEGMGEAAPLFSPFYVGGNQNDGFNYYYNNNGYNNNGNNYNNNRYNQQNNQNWITEDDAIRDEDAASNNNNNNNYRPNNQNKNNNYGGNNGRSSNGNGNEELPTTSKAAQRLHQQQQKKQQQQQQQQQQKQQEQQNKQKQQMQKKNPGPRQNNQQKQPPKGQQQQQPPPPQRGGQPQPKGLQRPQDLKVTPFDRQAQRFQKHLKIEEKREKSQMVREKNRNKARVPVEIICLDSDEEAPNDDDDDDVIVLPAPSPETINIVSDDDAEEECEAAVLEEEDDGTKDAEEEEEREEEEVSNRPKSPIELVGLMEDNAVDAADVVLDEDSASLFVKPQTLAATAPPERHVVEPPSRCNSPSSVMSTDDFIGSSDRKRLRDNSGVAAVAAATLAADQELEVVEADGEGDCLMEAPEPPQISHLLKESAGAAAVQMIDESSGDFAPPPAKNSRYRVDQRQFRAIDVYESESDIPDSVYSKGRGGGTRAEPPKPSIVRDIASSSEDDDEGVLVIDEGPRTKRLRKRTASSNAESGNTNQDEGGESDSSAELAINDGTRPTGVPFIARGLAVERKRTKQRRSSVAAARRASMSAGGGGGGDAVADMSDNQFMQTLNRLACPDDGDAEDDSETEAVEAPSARAIAESVLETQKLNQTRTATGVFIERPLSESDRGDVPEAMAIEPEPDPPIATPDFDAAVPVVVLANLDKVLETIDVLDRSPEKVVLCDDDDDDGEGDGEDDDVQIVGIEKGALRPPMEMPHVSYFVAHRNGHTSPAGMGWNEEMSRFYNNSWNGEKFRLTDVWANMDPDKRQWKVGLNDALERGKSRHLKCFNCLEFGHTRAKCPRPKKPLVCCICGEQGHLEPRCPNTVCLRCGNKVKVFVKSCNACSFQNRLVCPICKVRGHTLELCPDKWRRYHDTTVANVEPSTTIEYRKRKYCCICGGIGHLSENCRSAVRFCEYPLILSVVKSHQKCYDDVALNSEHRGLPVNLLYNPSLKFTFAFMRNGGLARNCYVRFLSAVGLEFMRRKRRKNSPKLPAVLDQPKRKASGKSGAKKAKTAPEPEQVPEISESGSVEILPSHDTEDEDDGESGAQDIVLNILPNSRAAEAAARSSNGAAVKFKTPTGVSHAGRAPEPPVHDSDSSYSFSEHFEMPASASASHALAELPDFIPLSQATATKAANVGGDTFISPNRGISKRFVAAVESEDEQSGATAAPAPTEAKIYLSSIHTEFLQSPAGHKYLQETAEAHNLRARVDITSVGHALVLFGLPNKQDAFYKELLQKNEGLSALLNNRRVIVYQQVPKRTDVLVRFLRENIGQLLKNLGNVNVLLKRLEHLERQQSKTGYKMADKVRRTLNMVLVGQAGLLDGARHLDKLLGILRRLMSEFRGDENTPETLRVEIDKHWKMIFTAYRHENYPQLVKDYNLLVIPNRVLKLNIDPVLLGQKVLDTNLTLEQKQRLQQTPTATPKAKAGAAAKKQSDLLLNPLHIGTSPGPQPPPKKKANLGGAQETPAAQGTSEQWSTKCENLLTQITEPAAAPAADVQAKQSAGGGGGGNSGVGVGEGKKPSMFWSRESTKFINDCLRKAESSPELAEKLRRVQKKSQNGSLSYNDYRAVVKLHTAMMAKKK